MFERSLVIFCLLLTGAQGALAATTTFPHHDLRTTYQFRDASQTFYNYDLFIKFDEEPVIARNIGVYALNQFYFQAGDIGGYIGLQKDPRGKFAIFSIWDAGADFATALPTGNCKRFGGEGSGAQCLIRYDWQTGREYRLRLWALGRQSIGNGERWLATVMDTTAGLETTIGTIELRDVGGHAGFGRLSAARGMIAVDEYYGGPGVVVDCSQLPHFKVTRRGPFADNDDTKPGVNVKPVAALVNFSGFGVGTDCPNNNAVSHAAYSVTMESGGATQRITPDGSDLWQAAPAVIPTMLNLNCPATLAANGSGGCTAEAAYSNGIRKTASPAWSSSNPAILSVGSDGKLAAGAPDADTSVAISATYVENRASVSATALVRVKADTRPTNIADCLFDWGEKNYPELFAPAPAVSNVSGEYYYRHYPGSGAYLGVFGNRRLVYAGGLSNGAVWDLGEVAVWVRKAGCG